MSMDIHTKPGSKVVVVKDPHTKGLKHDMILAQIYLKEGEVYTIERIEPGYFRTSVYLKELPKYPFNSVHFDNVIKNLN